MSDPKIDKLVADAKAAVVRAQQAVDALDDDRRYASTARKYSWIALVIIVLLGAAMAIFVPPFAALWVFGGALLFTALLFVIIGLLL